MFEVEHGDCIEVLNRLRREGREFDAIVADPPYCSGGITPAACRGNEKKYIQCSRISSTYHKRNGSFDDGMTSEAFYFFSRAWLVKARRVMRSPSYIFVFCDWRMLTVMAAAIQSAGFYYRGLTPWIKGNVRPNRGQISQNAEFILWGTKDARKSEKFITNGYIFESPPPAIKRTHPTEKPPKVFRNLFAILNDDARDVLDPFCGSGSAGIAAIDRGLNYYGVDNLEEYANKTRKRLEEYERAINGRTKEDSVNSV